MKFITAEKKLAFFEDKGKVKSFRVRVWTSLKDDGLRLCKPINAGAIFQVVSEDKTHVLVERIK